jgi:hypothetical protein
MKTPPPDEQQVAREALDAWRASRQRGSRFPEEQWSHAVELAQNYGYATTSNRLRLNPQQFRRRFDGARPSEAASPREAVSRASFVEVPAADLASALRSRPRRGTDAPGLAR